MKIAPYQFEDGVRLARIDGERAIDTGVAAAGFPDLAAISRTSGPAHALDLARLRAFVPPLLLGVGLNYADHAREQGRAVPETPALFVKPATSIAAPFGTASSPHPSFDYEGELAVMIGQRCWQVAEADAVAHVAGYLIVNDLTVRTALKPDSLMLGKGGPGHAPLGPWLTTADEIADPHALAITTHVNGVVRQNGSTAAMVRRVPWLIAWLSSHMVLEPGTVIATGSPPGAGAGMVPPEFLVAGDEVRVGIEGLGHIETRIVAA
ncbi:2-keto-4-pentenoate hydratase [Polymorphobacter multimanifer]|uniref:2-keto-4-pentenoate hydratase/2-oxohepta-3-ene-1,7-dioic acid hydratase in catechol pathway n=1 Tax=Polymorphobacter multimanifer TaxID=1070431 RepID=A0A841L2X0_9SPHN|nr:fumarylacetoacetate hydrolase family protein [Polymorphobacter multimanifer]MBB6226770.1 2-keto-4-pentenoate hydratase/2-oxohepta-3-ene-1,7-dioic acid hydratase in catechol pathway [Polymorphobacter multimanifer]GGI71502.1 2-keto-4-pentenoate hydratase [Polymorphobacter multimanifer]